ncbi:class I lanthipeptide [Chitinophaga sp. sic0106]|uniref:class I lanthipeptide n=1 Tax=Chitinophaga sp. sic0106 TaxID=2854785 RepID=UPI001C465D51|nr:class I lanthipeptide [Chitinophaga sp. sic0106]MBV7529427.1 class I lanthipeptide [Chitinophaga sp. sic0106]MBV7529428.1 class I lanthipeptide [Chitinophaga sp. sic0106]
MKKSIALQNSKLPFSKEKIANLTGEELDAVQGGIDEVKTGDTVDTASGISTHHNFTCCACTTLSGIAAEDQA